MAVGPAPPIPAADQESRKKAFGLTPRQVKIVSAVLLGYTNKDIARKYNISEDTVKHHLTNIFDKVGMSNRLELALFAIEHQLGVVRERRRGKASE